MYSNLISPAKFHDDYFQKQRQTRKQYVLSSNLNFGYLKYFKQCQNSNFSDA